MRVSDSLIIMETIAKIQNYMKAIGKIDWILNQGDDNVLVGIYFLNPSNRVDGEKVLKIITAMEKKLKCKCELMSIGKTVTFYLEVN